MTYSEQLQIIQDITIREGERRIITCPICHGVKKMSLSKRDGQLMWNCFRASCSAKGIHSVGRSLQSTKDYISNKSSKKSISRPVPFIITNVNNHASAVEYLKSNNSWEAYQNNLIDVKYDPASNRILFCHEEGAVGRLLSGRGPKWLSYGSIECGIAVGEGKTVVLVEDVASACSVSRLPGHTGLAMLGTKISNNIKKTLSKYNKVYLVLDKDANRHSINEVRKHGSNISVRFTSKDLKLLNICEIENVLKGGG